MINSPGDNRFKNNVFDFWTWSAPILQTPEEVVAKIRELKLIGRTIKDISVVGYSYQQNSSDAYYEIFKAIQRGDDKALASLEFPCMLEIDDPLLIRFEDGDVEGYEPRYRPPVFRKIKSRLFFQTSLNFHRHGVY